MYSQLVSILAIAGSCYAASRDANTTALRDILAKHSVEALFADDAGYDSARQACQSHGLGIFGYLLI